MSSGPITCQNCSEQPAAIKRPKDGSALCKTCFIAAFELLVHQTIIDNKLFSAGEKIAVAASGGKDSTVLAHVLKVLNTRHDYNLELLLLSVDEGIIGYRDDSLKAVKMNQIEYNLPLKVVSYDEMYGGWTMDKVVSTVGRRHNCTFCGVFRRQALDRGAAQLDADKVATGHNADDLAETVLMNLLRGDVPRLIRCVDIVTGAEGSLPRCKPLKYCFEKEIVMYARFLNLTYFATECIYSPEAFRGHLRAYVKDIERIRPRSILDIIESAEQLTANSSARLPVQGTCKKCGYITSQNLCKACLLIDGLNSDLPQAAIRNSVKPEDQNQKSSTLEQFQSLQVSGNGCGNCDCDGTRKVEI